MSDSGRRSASTSALVSLNLARAWKIYTYPVVHSPATTRSSPLMRFKVLSAMDVPEQLVYQRSFLPFVSPC